MSIRHERPADIAAREALLDAAFGETRYRKSSERLREGRLPAEGLSLIAADGKRVVGTARLWDVTCGDGKPALLLGPVAVACDCQGKGIGAGLVRRVPGTLSGSGGQTAAGPPRGAGGTSGLLRAECRLTAGRREPTESATETNRRRFAAGKGEMVR